MKCWVAPLLCFTSLFGQSKVHLPDQASGFEGIASAIVAAFDQVDIVALGEAHQRKADSELRIAVIRHPDFAKKVRFIVVEFCSTTEQSILDRYIRGENVSSAQLVRVWNSTTQAPNGVWDSPVYPEFLMAVRDVNRRLPADARIRVLGGDPGPRGSRHRETAAVSVLNQQVFQHRGKALVIYGTAHFYRAMAERKDYIASMGGDLGLVSLLDRNYPGRTLVVIPVGQLERPGPIAADVPPDYPKLERALKTHVRPVLVSLQRSPFRDFKAEEFLGRTLTTCRGPNGCTSVFSGSTLTLGQMADAFVYFGGEPIP